MGVFDKINNTLIVSVQAEGDDPFNSPETILHMVKAVEMGGAAAIRSEGAEKLKSIRRHSNLPLIGLVKGEFHDGSVCITRELSDVESLRNIGVDIVAVDGTPRTYGGYDGPAFIRFLTSKFPDLVIMADIAQLDEALACADAGAHCVSTTLSGYTPETAEKVNSGPDLDLVRECVSRLKIPVIAEGRFNTPEHAAEAVRRGAWAVVVGTAITRPRVVTGWFLNAVKGSADIK